MAYHLRARNSRISCKRNGIHHITSASYHPSTNGLAERGVQTLKRGLKHTTGSTVQEKLSRFLFNYWITPHSTTAVAPCELLMKRRLRSRLDLIHPDVSKQAGETEINTRYKATPTEVYREWPRFDENLPSNNPKWLPGVIVKVTGPHSYAVRLSDERIVRKHVDHIIRWNSSSTTPVDADDLAISDSGVPPTPGEDTSANPEPHPPEEVLTDSSVNTSADNSAGPRRSSRQSKSPDFLIHSNQLQT